MQAATEISIPSPSVLPPSLLIVSLPKSGTVYLNAALGRNLGLEHMMVCSGYFPSDHLSFDRLDTFVSRGGYIAASHIDPNPANLQLLQALLPRWVVHFRDPRASLLSWVHHVRRLYQEGRVVDLLRFAPVPPEPVLTGDIEQCIDWHIGTFFKQAIDWANDG